MLVGEIDIATAPELKSTINRLLLVGHSRIVVDLDGVTFMDAAAVEALITATLAVALAGGTLHVTHNPRFMRLLGFTGETGRLNVTTALQSNGPEPQAPGAGMAEALDPAGSPARLHRAGAADRLPEVTGDARLPSLLRQSGAGDELAFAALYDATAPRAYGLGLRLLGDPVQAADLVYEAYLYLWEHSARFQPTQGSAISWILMTVQRCAL